jgi:hypothetical protein
MGDHSPLGTPVNGGVRPHRWQVVVGSAAGLLLVIMVLLYYLYYPPAAGREQPIPFSHHLHAGVKQISCLVCHPDAADGPRSGVPPLQTCMLCHERIIINYPPIADLREHFAEGKPVEWVRINALPEYVYFNHQMHVLHGVDCSRCHGDVKEMDRVKLPQDWAMGICVQCHRDNGVTHTCYTCHR